MASFFGVNGGGEMLVLMAFGAALPLNFHVPLCMDQAPASGSISGAGMVLPSLPNLAKDVSANQA